MKTSLDNLETALNKWSNSKVTLFSLDTSYFSHIERLIEKKISRMGGIVPFNKENLTIPFEVLIEHIPPLKKLSDIDGEVANKVIDIINNDERIEKVKIDPRVKGGGSVEFSEINGKKPRDVQLSKYLSRYLDNNQMGIFGRWLRVNMPIVENKEVYLTIDPYKMMRCSTNCIYQSCFRPDGEYSYAPTSYIATPNAAMLYSLNSEGKKDFRAWVLLDSDIVLIGRRYGDDKFTDHIAKFMYSTLAKKVFGTDIADREELVAKIDDSVFTSDGFFYWDDPSYILKIRGTEVEIQEGFDENMDIPGYKERCECCGDIHYRDDMEDLQGVGWVCSDCRGDYRQCDRCGDYYYEVDGGIYPDSYGNYYCESCAERKGMVLCQECREIWVTTGIDDISFVDSDIVVCIEHRDNYYYGILVEDDLSTPYGEGYSYWARYFMEIEGEIYIAERQETLTEFKLKNMEDDLDDE